MAMANSQRVMALSKLNLKTSQLREGDSHGAKLNIRCDAPPRSPVMCDIIPLASVSDLITAGAGAGRWDSKMSSK